MSASASTVPVRAALLLNHRAGTLLARPNLADQIQTALRAAGFEVVPIGEDAAPTMQGRLRAAIESDAPVIIIGGGDGSVRSAAALLAGTDRVLGVLPLGTMNLLARDLGIPLDPLAAATALGHAPTRAIDAGYVNDEIFLCQSVIGLLNTIGRHRERLRGSGPLVPLRMVWIGLRTIWRHRPIRLALRLPGRPRLLRVWSRTLSIVVGAYADAPGRMFHRPSLESGELVLYRPRRFSVGWLLRMMLAMAMGRWQVQQQVHVVRLKELAILMRRSHITVKNDGEALLLSLPLRYRIEPHSLLVLAPEAPAAR